MLFAWRLTQLTESVGHGLAGEDRQILVILLSVVLQKHLHVPGETSLEDSWNHGIERNSQGILALTCSHALRRKG